MRKEIIFLKNRNTARLPVRDEISRANSAHYGRYAMRSEKTKGHITPIIRFRGIELEYRHQFNRRNSKMEKVRDFIDQTQEGALPLCGHTGVLVLSETSDMQLVHDEIAIVPGPNVASPVERFRFILRRKHA